MDKMSGQRAPSLANQEAFDQAVTEATRRLLDGFVTPPAARPPAMARSWVVARAKAQQAARSPPLLAKAVGSGSGPHATAGATGALPNDAPSPRRRPGFS